MCLHISVLAKDRENAKGGPLSLEKGLSLAIFLLSFTVICDTKLNSHYLSTFTAPKGFCVTF